MSDLADLCEAINDQSLGDQSVNLYQVEPEDIEVLKLVASGQPVNEVDAEWLKECGLVEVDHNGVSLTQFATSWLQTISQTVTTP